MCGGNSEHQVQTEQNKQQEILVEGHDEEQQELRQERREEREDRQETLIDQRLREEREFWARQEAPAGAAPVQQPPQEANLSLKQRIERHRQRRARDKAIKEGRKLTPYADEHTVQIKKGQETFQSQQSRAFKIVNQAQQNSPQGQRAGNLRRALAAAYIPDYRVDKKGRVLQEDAERVQTARQMAEAFLSDNEDLRAPYLDRIVAEMTAVEIRAEMFYPAYIREHFAEMRRLENRLMKMGHLMAENRGYFEALRNRSPELWALWDATRTMANAVSLWVNNTCEISGLDINGNRLGMPPITEAEFMVTRQEQDGGIREGIQIWETARQNHRAARGGE